MLTLYTWTTPNGRKISIMLEECGLPYEVKPVPFAEKAQFTPEYLAINPNNKIPSLVDSEGPDGKPYSVIESGAILWYLAEKTGQFLPADPAGRYDVLQWLFFHSASQGPLLGQAHHYRNFAPEKIPYAIERTTTEATRLYQVMDKRLAQVEYIAGGYSIADMAMYPWIDSHAMQGQSLADYPNIARWFEALSQRPGVQRGMQVPAQG